MNIRGLAQFYLQDWFEPATKVEPFISWYVPYSFPGYFTLLMATYMTKKALGPKFVVGPTLQFIHNMFLCAQSAFLVTIIGF